jgi:alkylation response protein AidB-like acyl-CoA dehydrogenase
MYGTAQQKDRFLKNKAIGEIKSWFALTESQAGSAVGRISTRFVQNPNNPDQLLVYGHKRFTTGVRLSNDKIKFVGILIGLDDDNKKRALIVELPDHESAAFKLFNYDLLPISRAWNIGMEFDGLPVPKANLIPKAGMVVPFSLLNRGRYFLLGGAMGTVLKYLKDLVGTKDGSPEDIGWVNFRYVQGHAIGDYEIVQHRLARMLGMAVTLRSLMASMGFEIDAGRLAEIDGLIAKPTASWYTNEAGDLSLTTWGGRGLLGTNASGAETQDRRAMKIYEGEDTVLILKLIAMILNDLSESTFGKVFDCVTDMLKAAKSGKSADLVKSAGKFFWNVPAVVWWMVRKVCRVSYGQPLPGMHSELKSHLAFALRTIERKVPLRVAGLFLKYGKNLPKHQAPLFRLGQKVMWANLMVHTVLWVHHYGDELEIEAALNELANLRRLIGDAEPTARDDARGRKIAQMIRDGQCRLLADVPVATKIPLAYHEPALGEHQPIAVPDDRIGRHE